MQKEEIKQILEKNMERAGLSVQEIRVQNDPYNGWSIVVISNQFEAISLLKRRETVLKGLENETIQWVDLLTPDEIIFAGELPIESEVELLPLWAEALARPISENNLNFASDLDEDLEPPIISTFYSLRGGIGRSTALAYTAQILAKRGISVLCVDMDLEAPGLAALFNKENEVKSGRGMLSVLLQLDQGETPELLDHIVRVSNSTELYCLPAGIPNADYARRLRQIEPEIWYRQGNNPLRQFIDLVKAMSLKIDVILFDSRTGISPISAPLLFDLSDVAIIGFYPHPQTEVGTKALVQALLNARSRRVVNGKKLTPEPRFLASPIPPREVDRYQHRAIEWVHNWFSLSGDERLHTLSESEINDLVHVIPYREMIAVSDSALAEEEILRNYIHIADWISRFLPTQSETVTSQSLPQLKRPILSELTFSTGAAELQDDFLETFVPIEVFHKASTLDRPLVIGRKGTGKTALFRWIVESDVNSIVVMCPAPFRSKYPWVFSPDGFAAIDDFLKGTGIGWREFWMVNSGVAIYQSMVRSGYSASFPRENLHNALRAILDDPNQSELTYVDGIIKALQIPSIGLLAWDWIQQLDNSLNHQTFILFDGLDTGFGNSQIERLRRKVALEGLFTFVLDREKSLKKIRFKLLLREDIWNKLRFENKTHLNVRIVKLEWRSQVDYVRTVIKQALRSKQFISLADKIIRSNIMNFNIEHWPDETVFEVWNLLVGERMKGGKSTYTVTWVWNRLADGNGDHSPRALFQLFSLATKWEEQEQSVNPYDKSVVRARALIVALESVSTQSLQSLLEEFDELKELASRLEEIGRSPIESSLLNSFYSSTSVADQLSLAKEVGLLEIYEETEDEVRRYRVPDLYRLALGMTRKGQA